jgi:hypothetical protein
MGAEVSQHQQAEIAKLSEAMDKFSTSIEADHDRHQECHSNKLVKSNSAYAHFADFSMFPDRFNDKSSSEPVGAGLKHATTPPTLTTTTTTLTPTLMVTTPEKRSADAHFSDYSLFPDRFNPALKYQRSTSMTPVGGSFAPAPGTSLPSSVSMISRYNFRLRSNSSTEREVAPPISPSSVEGGASGGSEAGSDSLSSQQQLRPRSQSHSSKRMYYFDYSMIPEKDPNYVYDHQRSYDQRREKPIHRPRLYSTGDIPINKSQDDITTKIPQLVITEEPSTKVGKAQHHTKARKNSGPRYGFFDYSMIPDKDPRFFKNRMDVNKRDKD